MLIMMGRLRFNSRPANVTALTGCHRNPVAGPSAGLRVKIVCRDTLGRTSGAGLLVRDTQYRTNNCSPVIIPVKVEECAARLPTPSHPGSLTMRAWNAMDSREIHHSSPMLQRTRSSFGRYRASYSSISPISGDGDARFSPTIPTAPLYALRSSTLYGEEPYATFPIIENLRRKSDTCSPGSDT